MRFVVEVVVVGVVLEVVRNLVRPFQDWSATSFPKGNRWTSKLLLKYIIRSNTRFWKEIWYCPFGIGLPQVSLREIDGLLHYVFVTLFRVL